MVEVPGGAPDDPSHRFRADIDEVSVVHLTEDGQALLIEWWRPGEGVRARRR